MSSALDFAAAFREILTPDEDAERDHLRSFLQHAPVLSYALILVQFVWLGNHREGSDDNCNTER